MNLNLIFKQMRDFEGNISDFVMELGGTGGIYSVSHPLYKEWLAKGNEPLPADTPVLAQTSDNTFTVQL